MPTRTFTIPGSASSEVAGRTLVLSLSGTERTDWKLGLGVLVLLSLGAGLGIGYWLGRRR